MDEPEALVLAREMASSPDPTTFTIPSEYQELSTTLGPIPSAIFGATVDPSISQVDEMDIDIFPSASKPSPTVSLPAASGFPQSESTASFTTKSDCSGGAAQVMGIDDNPVTFSSTLPVSPTSPTKSLRALPITYDPVTSPSSPVDLKRSVGPAERMDVDQIQDVSSSTSHTVLPQITPNPQAPASSASVQGLSQPTGQAEDLMDIDQDHTHSSAASTSSTAHATPFYTPSSMTSAVNISQRMGSADTASDVDDHQVLVASELSSPNPTHPTSPNSPSSTSADFMVDQDKTIDHTQSMEIDEQHAVSPVAQDQSEEGVGGGEGQVLGGSHPPLVPISPQRASWNPQQLLNPKASRAPDPLPQPNAPPYLPSFNGGYATQRQEPSSENPQNGPKREFVQTDEDDELADALEPTQQPIRSHATMLADLHGVEVRRAPKRVKVDTQEEAGKPVKAKFDTSASGGELAGYIKEHRDNAAQSQATAEAIDLTDDANDQLQAGIQPDMGDHVCFGMFETARMNVYHVPECSNPSNFELHGTKFWPMLLCKLKPLLESKDKNTIEILDGKRKQFARLTHPAGPAVRQLMMWSPLIAKFQAFFIERQPLQSGQSAGSDVSLVLPLQILLYGDKKMAKQLVYRLKQLHVTLVHPPDARIKKGVPYMNPYEILDMNDLTALGMNTAGLAIAQNPIRTREELTSEVMQLFDKLDDFETLEEYPDPPFVMTPLLRHQKQALCFMTTKEEERRFSDIESENNSLWRRIRGTDKGMRYKTTIFGHEQEQEPGPSRGGILADVPGLGKTLSILSLIASTMVDARDFAGEKPPPSPQGRKIFAQTRGTLIVCPLSIIGEWIRQLQDHVDTNLINFFVQHGQAKTKDIKKLIEYDIVITTYETVGMEFSNHKYKDIAPMSQVNWFRIVLDEAHIIRNPKTARAKALYKLHAQRRWAVTGTPIQNKLEDLGSLLHFLRFEPVSDPTKFKAYITDPLKNGEADKLPVAALRVLVDSLALRRDKSKLDLPQRHEHEVKLDFSKTEQRIHNTLLTDSRNKVKALTRNNKSTVGKGYIHILQSILRLRQACAHGKELLGGEDQKYLEGHDTETAIDLDAEEADEDPYNVRSKFTPEDVYRTYRLMQESDGSVCCMCKMAISIPTGPEEDDTNVKDGVFGHMSRCYDLVCNDDLDDYLKAIRPMGDRGAPRQMGHCPKCSQPILRALYPMKVEEYEEHMEEHIVDQRNSSRGCKKWSGQYTGPSTKVKALIHSLKENAYERVMNPDSLEVKSVVFSGWTQFLDLIEIALKDAGIASCRLDGRMDRVARARSIDKFNRIDGGPTVILVSIAAGGLGLNLTRGSRLYIMEPQFNPAQESQSCDRVHRIGQTLPVTITRFIMKDSFEEKVVEVQERKKKIANLTLGIRSKADFYGEGGRLAELKALFG